MLRYTENLRLAWATRDPSGWHGKDGSAVKDMLFLQKDNLVSQHPHGGSQTPVTQAPGSDTSDPLDICACMHVHTYVYIHVCAHMHVHT